MARRRRLIISFVLGLAAMAVGAGLLVTKGCASPPLVANRNPTGEPFPAVSGQSLEQRPVALPAAFTGGPAIVLVGYAQRAQFDIDRWLMGLIDAGVEARIVEVPTIPGLVPTLISGWIDDGMRAGIPRQDWASVVTLYGGAARPVMAATGTDFPQRTRVLVLDASGTIVWFDDEGYAARKALELRDLVARLQDG